MTSVNYMFKYTLDNKRYHTLNYYYKNKYGKKTFKVSLNGNFSCPNKEKDGHGCIFCSRLGSGDFAGNKDIFPGDDPVIDRPLKPVPDADLVAVIPRGIDQSHTAFQRMIYAVFCLIIVQRPGSKANDGHFIPAV